MTGAETESDPTLLKHSVGTVIASWFFREYRSYSRMETAFWALTQKLWCTQDTLISSLILFTAFSRSFLPCVAHLSMWRFASRTRVANFCSRRAELTGFNDKLNEGAVSGVAVVNPRQAGQWLCEVCFFWFFETILSAISPVKLLRIHCTSRLFLKKPSFSSFGELLIVTGQLADFAKIQLLNRRMQLTSMSNKTLYDCFYTVAFSIFTFMKTGSATGETFQNDHKSLVYISLIHDPIHPLNRLWIVPNVTFSQVTGDELSQISANE